MTTSRRFSGKPARAIATVVCGVFLGVATVHGQESSPLGGVWTLNRALSEMPREIGFNVDWMPPPDSGRDAGTNRGRRPGSGGRGTTSPYSAARESFDDAQRLQLLTTEARNPPTRLMVVDTPAAITITNELGQSRTLRPTGNDEWIEIEGVSVRATTQRQADRLVVTYRAATDRDVRYTYSPSRDHQQLMVDVEFLERGAGDKARRVYQTGITETASATPGPASPPVAPPAAGRPATPASGSASSPEKFDARPGAELRGLKALGILVEDLSTPAVACGLNHDALETALSARLTSGGLAVRKNSDDDTYLYVNVMTATMANGTCVSRYDAFLYTHATANVSYRDQPVLVQVSLIHRGGIATSAPTSHAASVTRGLENYVDLFVTQIRDANK